jgi:hypothetical protein
MPSPGVAEVGHCYVGVERVRAAKATASRVACRVEWIVLSASDSGAATPHRLTGSHRRLGVEAARPGAGSDTDGSPARTPGWRQPTALNR